MCASDQRIVLEYEGQAQHALLLAHRASQLTLLDLNFLAPRHTTQPIKEDSGPDIEDYINPHKTKVSPTRIPIRVDALQKLVRIVHLAVLAFAGSLRVAQKATSFRNVVAHVLGAGLIWWCKESLVLGFIAVGGCFAKRCGHEAGDKV
jgi:hypothetical protein